MNNHEKFMRIALTEAEKAGSEGEVPVGAIAILDGDVIARDHNRREQRGSPTAHAEVLVIESAAQILNTWRLDRIDIYSTLEPCSMCAGAMVQARLKRLVFGASDPKAGAAGSVIELLRHPDLNHHVKVIQDTLANECAQLMTDFFSRRRKAL